MLQFNTTRPQALLNAFDKLIKEGDIATWQKDSDGDYTHKAAQWKSRAWMRPTVVAGSALQFTILFSKNEAERRLVYSYYHGHLVESFLNHLYGEFTGFEGSPSPSGRDSAI
jgi:hypothetical protein